MDIDPKKIEQAVVEQIVNELYDAEKLYSLVDKKVSEKIDKIFAENVEQKILDTVSKIVADGFDREFRPVNKFGQPNGEGTTVSKELDRLTSNYWVATVDGRTGKPRDGGHGTVSRAEWVMSSICADDFSKELKKLATDITGNFKDGLRGQLTLQVNQTLDKLFNVKSLQDQGKVRSTP